MPRLNVQAVVRRLLEERLDGVEVRVSVPSPIRAPLVVVRREGGARVNALLDRPGIGVQVWAETEEEAALLAERVSDLMLSLPLAEGFADATEESLRSDPDQRTKLPRWYGSYTLTTFKYASDKEQ